MLKKINISNEFRILRRAEGWWLIVIMSLPRRLFW
jgi:hypothetical protein